MTKKVACSVGYGTGALIRVRMCIHSTLSEVYQTWMYPMKSAASEDLQERARYQGKPFAIVAESKS